MAGLTLDSGAMIAFERGDRTTMAYLKEARARGVNVTVPTSVVAEVWRGGRRSARVAALLKACIVEPLTEALARTAGEALAKVPKATVIDAIVMASAASRGDAVITSDPQDLGLLAAAFANVHVLPL